MLLLRRIFYIFIDFYIKIPLASSLWIYCLAYFSVRRYLSDRANNWFNVKHSLTLHFYWVEVLYPMKIIRVCITSLICSDLYLLMCDSSSWNYVSQYLIQLYKMPKIIDSLQIFCSGVLFIIGCLIYILSAKLRSCVCRRLRFAFLNQNYNRLLIKYWHNTKLRL